MIVFLIPVLGYAVLRYWMPDALHIPPRYYFDTVVVNNERGKKVMDTIWHRIADFKLINQLGDTISWGTMKGKVAVVNFFFTRCPSFCPRLSESMVLLQKAFAKNPNAVQLLSLSVDPEYDTREVIKKYADSYNANHKMWWLLTGSQEVIRRIAQEELHLGISEGVKDDFIHSDRFVLIDQKRVVRGYYNGQDSLEMQKLAKDIVLVYMEKQKIPSVPAS